MAAGPGDDRRLTAARVGLVLVLIGSVAFAVLAVLLVPWHPVPGGAPPALQVSAVFSATEIDRAETYAHTARLIGWSSLLVSLLVAAWLGFTSRGARLLGRRRRLWPLEVLLTVGLVNLIGALAGLPFLLLAWRRRTDVGLTHQGIGGLLRDQTVAVGIAVAVAAIAVLILVGLARRLPRSWPVAAAVLGVGLVVASSYAYPLLIEPAFNRFEPLPAGSLHSRIDAIARAEGVQVDEILVADASRRTTSLNAYVSGLGGSRRVVLYDTLLKLPEPEVEAVVGHELAHARHGDVLVGTALGAAGSVLGIGLLAMITGSSVVRRRAGVAGAADPRVAALVLALAAFGTVLAAPVENAISRQIETRADVDGLKATGDPVAFVAMQRDLALAARADPTPPAWSQWWFGSHPTALQRIAVAKALRLP
jgi:STE24 endopeptidase